MFSLLIWGYYFLKVQYFNFADEWWTRNLQKNSKKNHINSVFLRPLISVIFTRGKNWLIQLHIQTKNWHTNHNKSTAGMITMQSRQNPSNIRFPNLKVQYRRWIRSLFVILRYQIFIKELNYSYKIARLILSMKRCILKVVGT